MTSINLGEPLFFIKASIKDNRPIIVYSNSTKYILTDDDNTLTEVSRTPTSLSREAMKQEVDKVEYSVVPGVPGSRTLARRHTDLNKYRNEYNTFYKDGVVAYFKNNIVVILFRERFYNYKHNATVTYLSIREDKVYSCSDDGVVKVFKIDNYEPPINRQGLIHKLRYHSRLSSYEVHQLDKDYKDYFLYYMFYEYNQDELNQWYLIINTMEAIIDKIIDNKQRSDGIKRRKLPSIKVDFSPFTMAKRFQSGDLIYEEPEVYLSNEKSIKELKALNMRIEDDDNILYGYMRYPGHVFSYCIDVPNKTIEIYETSSSIGKYEDRAYIITLIFEILFPSLSQYKQEYLVNTDFYIQNIVRAYEDNYCGLWRFVFLYRRIIQGLSLEDMRNLYLINENTYTETAGINMYISSWNSFYQYYLRETFYFTYTTLKLLWDIVPPTDKYNMMANYIDVDMNYEKKIQTRDVYINLVDIYPIHVNDRYYGGRKLKTYRRRSQNRIRRSR